MAAMVSSSLSADPLSLCLCISTSHSPRIRLSPSLASLRPSSSSSSHESSLATQNGDLKSAKPSIKAPFVESSKPPDKAYNYALANPNGNRVVRFVQSTESSIERREDRTGQNELAKLDVPFHTCDLFSPQLHLIHGRGLGP